jgi:hypothetical protein
MLAIKDWVTSAQLFRVPPERWNSCGVCHFGTRCRAEPGMTSEELMRTAIEALGRGDAAPYEAALHDNVIWRSAREPDPDSDGQGRENVTVLLEKIASATTDFRRHWHARDIVSRGDIVWGLFDAEDSETAEMLVRWRMQDGKIVYAQTFS